MIYTKLLQFLEKTFNQYYWDCEEILIFNENNIPIDSYISRTKVGKFSHIKLLWRMQIGFEIIIIPVKVVENKK